MLATRCLYLSSIRMSQPTICSRLATAPLRMQPAIIWHTKPLAVAYSKDVKPEGSSTVAAAKPTNPTPSAEKKSESKPSSSSSSATAPSQFKKPDIKLPSRDQLESFLFKSLVYFWDFTYYVLCMSIKLFDTYIIKNPSVQHYWKLLLKRMEQARKETTTK